nr:lytic transglycosylase domain-containing protein [Sphingomonas sp.]
MLALGLATPSKADAIAGWRAYTAEASSRFGVPIEWIERVMRAESNGQTMLSSHPIRSRVGAIGLMQLMPGTWNMLRSSLALGPNPDDPHDNILAGTLYLRMMYERFGYPGMFAAYNVGPGRFAEHLATGQALPWETVAYLRKVSGPKGVTIAAAQKPEPEALFAWQDPTQLQPTSAARERSVASLFVMRNDAP